MAQFGARPKLVPVIWVLNPSVYLVCLLALLCKRATLCGALSEGFEPVGGREPATDPSGNLLRYRRGAPTVAVWGGERERNHSRIAVIV